MKKITALSYFLFCLAFAEGQPVNQQSGEPFPIRGLCIAAPRSADLKDFIKFVEQELVPRKVNTLILRVDFNYQFKNYPKLRDSSALSEAEVRKLVSACKKGNIRIIPQINLLGHQSWAGKTGNLLRVYPEFDETPYIKMPKNYVWPNPDGLYCKSYCPLHPGVHKVVFDLVDEICNIFNADAFHAGMDEVFYIGHDSCSRCAGRDKAELFSGEVWAIRNHLQQKGRQLWIWGDRLIDGKTTGMGIWEASYNNTYRAVDMIPKDVVICDWHYERADQTPVYFAMKGLTVVTCPWRMPDVAVTQAEDMVKFRQHATPEMKERYAGMVQTTWSPASDFLKKFYDESNTSRVEYNTQENCFKVLYKQFKTLAPAP
jgi:N-acetyl-beta-hexosaminidase